MNHFCFFIGQFFFLALTNPAQEINGDFSSSKEISTPRKWHSSSKNALEEITSSVCTESIFEFVSIAIFLIRLKVDRGFVDWSVGSKGLIGNFKSVSLISLFKGINFAIVSAPSI